MVALGAALAQELHQHNHNSIQQDNGICLPAMSVINQQQAGGNNNKWAAHIQLHHIGMRQRKHNLLSCFRQTRRMEAERVGDEVWADLQTRELDLEEPMKALIRTLSRL